MQATIVSTLLSTALNQGQIRDIQNGCKNVCVEGDATYCIGGTICGSGGRSCSKKGDVAVDGCRNGLPSWANGKCTATEDASCKMIKTGAMGCVCNSKAPQNDVKESRAVENGCKNVSVEGDATYCVGGSICGSGGQCCPKKGDVAVDGCRNDFPSWVNGKCTATEDASCKKIKTVAMGCVWNSKAPQKDVQATQANAVWQQCGGKNWSGTDYTCEPGNSCVVVNDWYSQCQPSKTDEKTTYPTWSQCGGKGWKDTAGKKCRSEDQCKAWNDYYFQCIPNKK